MSKPETPPVELPAELAELAGIAAQADARNAEQPAPGQAVAEAAPAADPAGEITAMLDAVMTMAEPVAPYLRKAYTPEVCERIGVALAMVAEKRGWDLSKLASPEAMLAFVTIPPTIAAYKLGRDYYAWLEQQSKPAPAPKPEAVVADGG